jgi:hypothetical protein
LTRRGRSGRDDVVAGILAAVLLVAAALIELALYRPQAARVRAAAAELGGLHSQAAAVARRGQADRELLDYAGAGPDGEAFRALYSAESGLVYLNRAIEASGLSRSDFGTEAVSREGPFVRERFYVSLTGPFGRVLSFLKSLEGGRRLARVEQLSLEPVEGSGQTMLNLRVVIYGLPAGGAPR